MKALTLSQPYASLMALQAKTIETRSWGTKHRGELVIHSSITFPPNYRQLALNQPEFVQALQGIHADDLPLGYGVCVVRVIGCVKTSEMHKAEFILGRKPSAHEIMFGNYQEGRYAWLTEFVRKLDNIGPVRGAQSLWEWGDEVDHPCRPDERRQVVAERLHLRGGETHL